MTKGIVVGEYTVAFAHVQRTEVTPEDVLMVWCNGDYFEILDPDNAAKFRSAFLQYLGLATPYAYANEQGEVPF